MVIIGEKRRSQRVGLAGVPAAVTPPSSALAWKAPLDFVPQKLDDVVHGTTAFLPPWCTLVQLVGSAPAATPSKLSANTVVEVRVPVSTVACSVARPNGEP